MQHVKTSSPEVSREPGSEPACLGAGGRPSQQALRSEDAEPAAVEERGPDRREASSLVAPASERASAAGIWPPLRRFISGEQRLGRVMAQKRWTAWLYEFVRFGLKQGWACLFGGIAVTLMIGTWRFYPASAPLARYDFLFLCMVAVQAILLASRLETSDEAKVILIYHLVGTLMEIFKTKVGSWIYPEPSLLRIAGVPLFTGFMYGCIGSYLCRAWRLFDFRFENHPRRASLVALSLVIYANFFADHYGVDLRLLLYAVAALLFARTTISFKIWHVDRSMPLLLGLVLVSLFIWISENIGTFTKTWLYPSQSHGWAMVSFGKLGSWFLLLIISYTLVSLINGPRTMIVRKPAMPETAEPESEAA
jgi:uncharacterized membrane protein YoaT (DUF817 family)